MYSKTIWIDGETQINASKLNKIEDSIENAHDNISVLKNKCAELSKDLSYALTGIGKVSEDIKIEVNSKTDEISSTLEQKAESITTTFTEIHNNGYEQGSTKINKDGVFVSNTNVNASTSVNADGFRIYDEKGNVIAQLTSKEQWMQIVADKVISENICNLYCNSNILYINHNFASDSDGTVEKPFKSFKECFNYIYDNGRIINTQLTIRLETNGVVCEPNIEFKDILGCGSIRFEFSNTVILYSNVKITNVKPELEFIGNNGYVIGDGKSNIFNITNCGGVYIHDFKADGKSSTTAWANFCQITSGYGFIENCDVKNIGALLALWNGARGVVNNNKGTNVKLVMGVQYASTGVLLGTVPNYTASYSNDTTYGGTAIDKKTSKVSSSQSSTPTMPLVVSRMYSLDTKLNSYEKLTNVWTEDKAIQGYCNIVNSEQSGEYDYYGVINLDLLNMSKIFESGECADGSTLTIYRDNELGENNNFNTFDLYACNNYNIDNSSTEITPLTDIKIGSFTLFKGKNTTITLPKSIMENIKNGVIKSFIVHKVKTSGVETIEGGLMGINKVNMLLNVLCDPNELGIVKVEGVSFSQSSYVCYYPSSVSIYPIITPIDATDKTFTYTFETTEDTLWGVVKYDDYIQIINKGATTNATLTVSVGNGSYTASCTVKPY